MRTLVVLGLGGLLLFGTGCSVSEPPAAPASPAPLASTAAPASPGPIASTPVTPPSPQASPAPSPMAFEELTFDQLLEGLLLLEKSPVPLTREQAIRLDAALGGRVPDFDKGGYLTTQATQILTPEQRESLADGGERSRPASDAQGRALLQELERLAGSGAPGQVEVPEGLPPGSDKPAIASIDLLATEPSLVEPPLTSEQARALLPVCRAYVALDTTIEEVLRSVLTEQQEKFIAARVDRGGSLRDDMEALMQQVRALVSARAKS